MNLSVSNLDSTDFAILKELQADGRLSNAKLSEKLVLSETPCWRRLKRLEAEGYIESYQAVLNRKMLGFGVVGFAQITVGNHSNDEGLRFEEAVALIPEIWSCHNVTGEYDYILQIVAKDLDAYGDFIRDRIRKLPGVTSIHSSLSLREIKRGRTLPF